jgi:mannose-6-phosphate isomerase
VWRSYAGGSVLRQFRGLPPRGDDHFPEDWLASTVRARNAEHSHGTDEGLTRVQLNGNSGLLLDLLRQKPGCWLGERRSWNGNNLGVLWKLLDSSVRLQIQAHPSGAFARAHLGGNAGKTECWYILGTRGSGYVYLGFQKPPSRADWATMIREQRIPEMLHCFERIKVQPGDCYVVPAGTPHAIGEGVFMVELMEPTDFVVRCETVTAGVALSPEACFMGIGLERALEIFDFQHYSVADVRNTFQQRPSVLTRGESYLHERIIENDWHQFFRLERLSGTGEAHWEGEEFMVAIVVEGNGELGPGATVAHRGQAWLLPGCVEEWKWKPASPEWRILLLKLPQRRDGEGNKGNAA